MAEARDVTDLLPRRPSALFAIGALGGFVVVLTVALLLMIAKRAPDDIRFVAMDPPSAVQPEAGAGADGPLDGLAIAQANGCVACHSTDGASLVGPTWFEAFGSERMLEDGSTVTVDRAYLRTAIVDPAAQIAAGFPGGVMPATYVDTLSGSEIDAIVDFIEGLGA